MNAKAIKSSIILVAALATVVIAQGQSNLKNETGIGIDAGEIRAYRKMFRVNEKPVDMVEETKMMCAPPLSVYGPHYDPGVVYYINEILRQGLATYSHSKQFPVGSIIVKEK